MTDDHELDLEWISRVLDPSSSEVDRQVADIVRHARRGGRISPEAHQMVWNRLGPLLGATVEQQAATYLAHYDHDGDGC
jgi:hypothetical protein